jgi:flagellar hook-basal body complex protein FliE
VVLSQVQSNPSFSLDDVQSMINSILERQAKSDDELIRRLIEQRDGKKLVDYNVNSSSSSCTFNFAQTILNQVIRQWAAHHSQTYQPNRRITFTVELPLIARLLLVGCRNKLRPAYSGNGTHTAPSFSILNPGLVSYTPSVMAGHTQITTVTIKSRTSP